MKKSTFAKVTMIAALSGALLTWGAASAQAATFAPTTNAANTIAPGAKGDVGATIMVNSSGVKQGDVTLFLTAPAHTTFTETQIWGRDIVEGVTSSGTHPVLSCTASAGNTVLTCAGPLTIQPAGNGSLSGLIFTAQVLVDSGAPSDTVFTNGDFNMTNGGDISGGRTNLQYKTPAVVDTPIVAPVIAGGAGLAAAAAIGAVTLIRRKRATV